MSGSQKGRKMDTNLYNARFAGIRRRNQFIRYSYLALFGLIFIFVFYILFCHISAHFNYKRELTSKFYKNSRAQKPEDSKLTHFSNIASIKKSIYDLYIGNEKKPAGLGISLLPDMILSVINYPDIYILSDNEYYRLDKVGENQLIAIYESSIELAPISPSMLGDFSDFDITEEAVMFTRVNGRFTFSTGIISSKHSIIDKNMLIETDIRFDNTPKGSLLLSDDGNILGFGILDIDGSINLFVSANEMFSIQNNKLQRFLSGTPLQLETWNKCQKADISIIQQKPGTSPLTGMKINSFYLPQNGKAVFYLSFMMKDELYEEPFDARIVIETLKGGKYIKDISFNRDMYMEIYPPNTVAEAMRIEIDIDESGPAVWYFAFDDFKTMCQRIFLIK